MGCFYDFLCGIWYMVCGVKRLWRDLRWREGIKPKPSIIQSETRAGIQDGSKYKNGHKYKTQI